MTGDGDDKFICIPEELWRHMISVLPMDDAVRTSILTRKWKEIWHSNPSLIFDYEQFPQMDDKEERFVTSIQQTLDQHDISNIENFSIVMSPDECHEGIREEWIILAINHKAQNLYLLGEMEEFQALPDSLFMSKSLTKINLAMPDYVLVRQEKVFLPNLKELRLRGLVIADSLEETLESCPALDLLVIIHCDFSPLETLNIFSASITGLTICHCEGIEHCKIRFKTPVLVKFRMVDGVAYGYKFLENSSPCSVFISFDDSNPLERNMTDLNKAVFQLYTGLHSTNVLVFNPWFIEFLSSAPDSLRQVAASSLGNLCCLNPFMWPTKNHNETMMFILSKSPSLRHLEIVMVRTGAGSTSNQLMMPHRSMSIKFPGILQHLTHASIDRFEEKVNELELVKFLLGNAPALLQLRLSKQYGCDEPISQGHVQIKTEIRKKICRFKRLSKAATIKFC